MHTILVQKRERRRLCEWPRHGCVDNIKIGVEGDFWGLVWKGQKFLKTDDVPCMRCLKVLNYFKKLKNLTMRRRIPSLKSSGLILLKVSVIWLKKQRSYWLRKTTTTLSYVARHWSQRVLAACLNRWEIGPERVKGVNTLYMWLPYVLAKLLKNWFVFSECCNFDYSWLYMNIVIGNYWVIVWLESEHSWPYIRHGY